MKYAIRFFLLMSLVFVIAGCGKIVDWSKARFEQGESLGNHLEVAQNYIRSIAIYDQFTTEAKFDALWLSDSVRSSYVNLYSLKRGKDLEQQKIFLRRQIEENKHFIAFYVLSLFGQSLGEAESKWTLFLKIGDKTYFPIEIKVVDLIPEYQAIFDKRYSRFKEAYMVKFNALDSDDKPILTQQVPSVTLCFRSANKEATLNWDLLNAGSGVNLSDIKG